MTLLRENEVKIRKELIVTLFKQTAVPNFDTQFESFMKTYKARIQKEVMLADIVGRHVSTSEEPVLLDIIDVHDEFFNKLADMITPK